LLAVLVWLGNVVNIGNSMNMVSYLRGTMNMGVAAASTTSTMFVAVMQMFSIYPGSLRRGFLHQALLHRSHFRPY
jgi:hypothetical protein